MPWFNLNAMNDQKLLAIFEYIRYLGPADGSAPAYVPPDQEPDPPSALYPPPPESQDERPLAGGAKVRYRPILLKNSDTRRLQNSLELFRVPDAQSKVTFSAFERHLSEFSYVSDYPLGI